MPYNNRINKINGALRRYPWTIGLVTLLVVTLTTLSIIFPVFGFILLLIVATVGLFILIVFVWYKVETELTRD